MSERDVQRILDQIRELPKHEQSLLLHRMQQPDFSIKIYHGTGYIGFKMRFVKTGEFRAPKKGEWYLSGAIPEGYQAPNDLIGQFHILKQI